MRHQQWICYQLQSTGSNESTFLDSGVDIGPGKYNICGQHINKSY